MKPRTMLAALAPLLLLAAASGCGSEEPLKIGLLLDYSSSPLVSAERQRGFELAIAHVNENGGVFGHPVDSVTADAPSDLDIAVASARRLVEDENVHAFVGPNSSAASTRIAQEIAAPAGVPAISPSATAPTLTTLNDSDFFFRVALSDASQGPVLARVVREQGFSNLGLTYRDDPYGRGLAQSFAAAWNGDLLSVRVPTGATDYAPLVRETAAQGAQALVVIDFGNATQAIVQAALDEQLYDRFYFGDAGKRLAVVQAIGGEHLANQYGTAAAPHPNTPEGEAWNTAYAEQHGSPPAHAYVRECYDAALAIMLAAEQAGSADGAAIRDNLRSIATPPGAIVHANPAGVAEALRLIRDGEEINLEGVSGTLDWDANGDILAGHMGVWRYTADEQIEVVEVVELGH